jgi:hypothetical protein
MIEQAVAQWHRFVEHPSADVLEELLADDVVFYSPVVYTPQQGKAITSLYLLAAAQTLGTGGFRYTKQVLDGDTAVLEFETTLDGRYVNGVDIIRCDESAHVVEFRVMVRPLKAVDAVHQQMRAMLTTLGGQGSSAS